MLPATTLNYLVWENVSNLPFPKEMKELVNRFKWQDFEWQCANLPVNYAKYDVSDGKVLYLSQLPDGSSKTEKQDFTGDIPIAGYIVNDDKEGYNWFVSFIVTFVKGEVADVQLDRYQKQDAKEYDIALSKMTEAVNKRNRRYNSWWYKYLYIPWVYFVKIVFFVPVISLSILKWLVVKLARLISLVDFIG